MEETIKQSEAIQLNQKVAIAKQELEHLYNEDNYSQRDLAQYFKVSQTVISNRMKEYDIDVRKREVKIYICQQCKKEFSGNYGKPNKYCSPKCYWKAMRETEFYKGRNSSAYSEGNDRLIDKDDREWAKQRFKTLRRDNEQCQKCGMGQEEHLLEFGKELHIHHINPYRESQSHALSNLVTLCGFCHAEVEGGWNKIRQQNKPK